MLPTKFRFNWLNSFREEDFQKLTNQKKKVPAATTFVTKSGQNLQSLQRTFHRCFLPNVNSFGKADSAEKIFQKSPNQKQELPVAAKFVNESGRNEQSLQRTFHTCFLPNFSSFRKAVSEEKIFQKSTNQKQEWLVAAMFVNGSGRNEQSIIYREPSIDAFYQVSVHLAKRFQRRRFLKIGQSETRIACGGHVCQWIGTK